VVRVEYYCSLDREASQRLWNREKVPCSTIQAVDWKGDKGSGTQEAEGDQSVFGSSEANRRKKTQKAVKSRLEDPRKIKFPTNWVGSKATCTRRKDEETRQIIELPPATRPTNKTRQRVQTPLTYEQAWNGSQQERLIVLLQRRLKNKCTCTRHQPSHKYGAQQ